MPRRMKAADDGPKMNHGKIFKSFSVIYDVTHFNENGRRGARMREFVQLGCAQSNQVEFNLN